MLGKTVLITGGSEGIGRAIADTFARSGARLILLSRSMDKLESLHEQLLEQGAERVRVWSVDLADPAQIDELLPEIKSVAGKLDVLINNAGMARFTPFVSVTSDELDMHINLNMKAPFRLAQGLLEELKKSQGVVINISSYFSDRMLPDRPSTVYSMTKGALNSLTKAMAFELGPLGIRVCAIAPGTVNTGMVAANLAALNPVEQTRFAGMIKNIYPLQRIGEPEDLAGMAHFLASDSARWITGSIFAVDGGLTTN